MPAAQKLRAVVEEIVAHGDRVYTLVLRPEGQAPRFRAGQFLHLALDAYDPTGFWPDSRAFSIVSSPSERERVVIAYSVQGRFTKRMESELVKGRSVWIKMPYGDFVVDVSRDVVLFAGGTGMTAFTAFLDGLTRPESSSVTVAYGARTRELLIYRDLVERCAQRMPTVDAIYFVEDTRGAVDPKPIPAGAGRISVDAVWSRLRRPFEAAYYISGPPLMLQSVGENLRARNISPEAIHIDAWE